MAKKPVAHHDLIVLPDHIPHDTFDRVVEIFQGSPIDAEDGHRLLHIVCYAYGRFHVHDPLVFSAAPPMTAEEIVEELKAHKDKLTGAAVKDAAVGAPPAWLLAFGKLALQFLLRLLG